MTFKVFQLNVLFFFELMLDPDEHLRLFLPCCPFSCPPEKFQSDRRIAKGKGTTWKGSKNKKMEVRSTEQGKDSQ